MPVHVEGLNEITRAMEKAGVELEDLKDAMGAVAAEAAQTMEGFVPTGRTGKLRGTVRGNRAKARAIVTVGTARVPYAAPIIYGWPRRNIKSSRSIERTDAVMDERAAAILENGWDQIAQKNGLT